MKVIVYYRTRPSEPEASEVALTAQRTAVASWVAEHHATPIAEFVQPEQDGEPPRELWKALKACRRQNAALLIAMTDPIGSGRAFGPYSYYGHVHCASLTHAKPKPPPPRSPAPPEPVEAPPPPTPIPLPDGAPDRLCLCFDPGGFPKLPVYICNPGPDGITNVIVTSAGTSSHWTTKANVGEGDEARTIEVPIQTSTAKKSFEALASGTCIQVDRYDVFYDGDFITLYEVAWTDQDGTPRQGRATIGTGGPKARWIALD